MMVPAVTEVWRRQPAHSKVQALLSSRQALVLPHPGQTKPSGHRVAARYSAQASSSPKRCSNSVNDRSESDPAPIDINLINDRRKVNRLLTVKVNISRSHGKRHYRHHAAVGDNLRHRELL